jgi:predicted nucleotidyltransferase
MPNYGAALEPALSCRLAERLGQEDELAAAYLLGSGARGSLRPDSDLDLALLPVRGRVIAPEDRLSLAADLEELAGRQVDLGVLSTANLVYAKEAVAQGVLLFERDPSARARFAMLVLSMYAALQESRREVLHAYAA